MIPSVNSPTVAYTLALVTYALNCFGENMSNVSEGLWVGNIAAAWDSNTLKSFGIDAIVCITQFGDAAAFYPNDFSYYVLDIQDVPESNIGAVLAKTADFIDAHIRKGKRVLVHCNQGKSRSATVAAAYLVTHRGMDATGALDLLRRRRPVVCPNPGFIRQLYNYAETRRDSKR